MIWFGARNIPNKTLAFASDPVALSYVCDRVSCETIICHLFLSCMTDVTGLQRTKRDYQHQKVLLITINPVRERSLFMGRGGGYFEGAHLFLASRPLVAPSV